MRLIVLFTLLSTLTFAGAGFTIKGKVRSYNDEVVKIVGLNNKRVYYVDIRKMGAGNYYIASTSVGKTVALTIPIESSR